MQIWSPYLESGSGLRIRTPDTDDFQNLKGTPLVTVTFTLKFARIDPINSSTDMSEIVENCDVKESFQNYWIRKQMTSRISSLMHAYVNDISKLCIQRLYSLKLLRKQRPSQQNLNVVFHSLIVYLYNLSALIKQFCA